MICRVLHLLASYCATILTNNKKVVYIYDLAPTNFERLAVRVRLNRALEPR